MTDRTRLARSPLALGDVFQSREKSREFFNYSHFAFVSHATQVPYASHLPSHPLENMNISIVCRRPAYVSRTNHLDAAFSPL